MPDRPHTYAAYSFGCAVVWALLLAVVRSARREEFDQYRNACMMWWAGWMSATIARSVYPPPKRHLTASSAQGRMGDAGFKPTTSALVETEQGGEGREPGGMIRHKWLERQTLGRGV